MKKGMLWFIFVLSTISFGTGCSVDDAFQKGLSDGVSAALAYIIKTPVTTAVDQAVKPK